MLLCAEIHHYVPREKRGNEDDLAQMVETFVNAFEAKVDKLDKYHMQERLLLNKHKYAINIVPDIINVFGNADNLQGKPSWSKTKKERTGIAFRLQLSHYYQMYNPVKIQ